MLTPIIAAVDTEGFHIVPTIASGSVDLKLSGSCDSQTLPLLERFLGTLHHELVRAQAKTVVLDCDALYFMNSAAIKCFVTWLHKVKALPKTDSYSVSVRTNQYLAWQRRTFGAIHRSAPEVFSVEARVESPPR